MLVVDGVRYRLWTPEKESEFELFVKEHTKDLFGEDSIYFDLKQKLTSEAGVGSIPDGYVMTLSETPRWYVIEVELSSHPLYEHIVPQLSKFIHGIRSHESRREIIEALYTEITSDPITEAIVKKKIGSEEVYRFLTNLVSSLPTLVVVIDQKTKELEEACNSLPPIEKYIVEFRIFERVDAGIKNAYLFEPLYKGKIEKAPPIEEKIPIIPTGERIEIVLGRMHTPRKYSLIPLYLRMTARRFFPGYKIPFILETDIGDVEVRVTSGKSGDQVGDPDAGKYIQGKGLKDWYNKHKELESGDVLIIEKTDKEKRYKLTLRKR